MPSATQSRHEPPQTSTQTVKSKKQWGPDSGYAKPKPPSFNTSTASITRAEGIQLWGAKAPLAFERQAA
jgi:hypothetical protein